MNNKFLFLFLIFQFLGFNAQVHERYPAGQSYYVGGDYEMFKDMIKIAKDNKLKKCDDRNQVYYPSVIVNPDFTISFVKDFDTININKNRCAYNFTKSLLPHMKKWIPAKVNNVSVKAIVKFSVMPFIIYNSKVNPEENIFTPPTFSNGMKELERKIGIVLSNDVMRNTNENVFVIFIINIKGNIKDAGIYYAGDEKYEVLQHASKLKNLTGDWAPATFNSVPIDWFLIFKLDPKKKKFKSEPLKRFDYRDVDYFRSFPSRF